MTRTTVGRGAIYTVPDAYATQASLHVTFGTETVTVDGYRYVIELGADDDAEEEEGVFLTSQQRYSGYTLAECLCKSLIDMQIAEDWAEAIVIVEEMGVPYVGSDTPCDSCEENLPLTHNPETDTWLCEECAD
jgi:hypothetical protein